MRSTEYPNTGYFQDLQRNRTGTQEVLTELKKHLWIDRGTRALTIDFTVYNANINLFCVVQLLVEFPATGGVYTTSQFKTVKLLHLKGSLLTWIRFRIQLYCSDNYDYFILGTEILYMLYILYYTGTWPVTLTHFIIFI